MLLEDVRFLMLDSIVTLRIDATSQTTHEVRIVHGALVAAPYCAVVKGSFEVDVRNVTHIVDSVTRGMLKNYTVGAVLLPRLYTADGATSSIFLHDVRTVYTVDSVGPLGIVVVAFLDSAPVPAITVRSSTFVIVSRSLNNISSNGKVIEQGASLAFLVTATDPLSSEKIDIDFRLQIDRCTFQFYASSIWTANQAVVLSEDAGALTGWISLSHVTVVFGSTDQPTLAEIQNYSAQVHAPALIVFDTFARAVEVTVHVQHSTVGTGALWRYKTVSLVGIDRQAPPAPVRIYGTLSNFSTPFSGTGMDGALRQPLLRGAGEHSWHFDGGLWPRGHSQPPSGIHMLGYTAICGSSGFPAAYSINVTTCPSRSIQQYSFNGRPLYGADFGDCEGSVTVLDDPTGGRRLDRCVWTPTRTAAVTATEPITVTEHTGSITVTVEPTPSLQPSNTLTRLPLPPKKPLTRPSLNARAATAAAGAAVASVSPAAATALQRGLLQSLWMSWVVVARYHALLIHAEDLDVNADAVELGKPSASPRTAAVVLYQHKPSSLGQRLRGFVGWLMDEEHVFVAYARDPLFVKQYAPLFDGYVPARRWFLCVELCVAYAGGVLAGVVGTAPEEHCAAIELLNLALNALVLCAAAARPYRSWFDTINFWLTSVSALACSLLSLLAPDAALTVLEPIVTTQVYLSVVLLGIPFVVLAYVRLKQWRNELRHKIAKKFEQETIPTG